MADAALHHPIECAQVLRPRWPCVHLPTGVVSNLVLTALYPVLDLDNTYTDAELRDILVQFFYDIWCTATVLNCSISSHIAGLRICW